MQPMISVCQVSKAFGNVQVLRDVSLQVDAAELFGLIGLNGIGKTTLIKVMLDLIRADAGQVHLLGRISSDYKAREHVMYVPEKTSPNRNLKGVEYITLTLQAYRHRVSTVLMEEAAAAFQLDPAALYKTLRQCSKGMGQKLALMAAFLSPAPLLILDEPMSGLDPLARHAVKQQMRAAQGSGRTVFFSSHILADMDEICNRVAVIHDGTLRYTGDASGLRTQFGAGSLEEVFLRAIGHAA